MKNDSDFIKRIEDLYSRSERKSELCSTGFLTPAEQYELSLWLDCHKDANVIISGGAETNERQAAFFLPWYIEKEDFSIDGYICAVKIQSFFGEPGHRDYMGSVLGLGIKREWIGDFIVDGGSAYVYCLPSVKDYILNDLKKVGSCGVKAMEISLEDVPANERKTKNISFTVKSLRLDAVTGDMFGISRTKAADVIKLGAVLLNYSVCDKIDTEVREGDIITFRGKGKGRIKTVGGRSKKDRLFIEAEIYI